MTAERVTRGQPSRIDQLPEEIRERLDAMLRGGVTQREILRRLEAPLREIGERPLSRSGLNRYATRMEEVGHEIRQSRAVADAWMSQLGERPTGAVGRLTAEIVRTLAFKVVQKVGDQIDVEDDLSEIVTMLNELSLLHKRMAGADVLANKSEREQQAAYEARLREQREQDAAKLRDMGRARGLSPDVLEAIDACLMPQ